MAFNAVWCLSLPSHKHAFAKISSSAFFLGSISLLLESIMTARLLLESIMTASDQKDVENSTDGVNLSQMSKFVRFLAKIFFLPIKLEEDKAVFSLCSIPTLLNLLLFYIPSVSLNCLLILFYLSSSSGQAAYKSFGFVDILSGTSFNALIHLFFPALPLLMGQVSILKY